MSMAGGEDRKIFLAATHEKSCGALFQAEMTAHFAEVILAESQPAGRCGTIAALFVNDSPEERLFKRSDFPGVESGLIVSRIF